MSIDGFARAAFPSLRTADDGAADRERARGYARGHAEGFRAAQSTVQEAALIERQHREERDASARRAQEDALAALGSATAALSDRADDLAALTTQQILSYAVELAEIILAAELSDAGRSAAAAARHIDDAGPAVHTVHLHPRDYASLSAASLVPESIALVADDALAPGDAVLHVDAGWLDARTAASLDRARRVIDQERS